MPLYRLGQTSLLLEFCFVLRRVLFRGVAVAIAVSALYFIAFNTWWVFVWERTFREFDRLPRRSLGEELLRLAPMVTVGIVVLVLGMLLWRNAGSRRSGEPRRARGQ